MRATISLKINHLKKAGLGSRRNSRNRRTSIFSTLAVFTMLCGCFFAGTQAARGQTFSVLYTFCSQPNCTDGATPNPNLVIDQAGNLYGTTMQGGDNSFTEGVAFTISPGGTEKVLFDFDTLGTGIEPEGGLTMDASGNSTGARR